MDRHYADADRMVKEAVRMFRPSLPVRLARLTVALIPVAFVVAVLVVIVHFVVKFW